MLDRQNDPETLNGDEAQAASSETPSEYRVGFGRPPIKARFQPGRSGNPKGRPKGSRNLKTAVTHVMGQKISILENGRKRRVTKFEAMLQAAAVKAIRGDTRALNALVTLMARSGNLAEIDSEAPAPSLSENDAAILHEFLRDHTWGK